MKHNDSLLKLDLHVHTNYSFDSNVTMEQYALRAVKLGLDVVCFTDHIDINKHYDTFASFDFEGRQREFERVRKQFEGKVRLLLGFEMGEPHLHPKETAFLRSLNPDMIIGSVHYPMDYEKENILLPHREYECLYGRYVRDMVMYGDFDVLGHMDMPKKYHPDFVDDFDYVYETLKLCVAKNIIPEINTSSLRSGVSTTMPSLAAIERYAQMGGKYVTLNSDSHNVQSLGDGLTLIEQLPNGVELCYFEQGQLRYKK